MKHALGFNAVQHAACDRDGASSRNIGFKHGMASRAELGLGNIPQLAFSAALSRKRSSHKSWRSYDQPNRTANNTFQWVDNVSHTTARHSFKLGADIPAHALNRFMISPSAGKSHSAEHSTLRMTETRIIPECSQCFN